MEALNLPSFDKKIKHQSGKPYIWDITRRKYVALTPEEWVRQHFINFLWQYKAYPKALITSEVAFRFHELTKRSDILVYNREGRPVMLVECKAPGQKINQKVFEQASRYNHIVQAPLLVVTNGHGHYCCRIDHGQHNYEFLQDIPAFQEEL